MAKLIALLAIALFSLCFVNAAERPEDAPFANINDPPCTLGDVWAEQKIKMECVRDGVKPIACLPNAEIDGVEVAPGQTWTNPSFKYQCIYSDDKLSLSFDVIACLLPNGGELPIGSQEGVTNKGIYRCVKNADGTIARKYQAGCFFTNGRLYTSGQSWILSNTQIVCAANGGTFEAKASGCVVDGGQVVHVGGYHEMSQAYYKCQVNEQIPWQAEFNKVDEAEYHEYMQGNAGEEEEAAGGDSGSGFIRPTTPEPEPDATTEPQTEPPTEIPTEPQTEPQTTTQPPTTTACPTFAPPAVTAQGVTTPAATTRATTTPSPNQCEDLHPVCKDLCALRCEEESKPKPTTPKPNQQGKPCSVCGGKPQKPVKEEIPWWNLLIVNDKPGRYNGRNKRGWNINFGGGKNDNDNFWNNGNYWRPNQGGKSSSSSEEQYGRPHSHGHGRPHHHGSKERPRPQPQPQPQPNGQCFDLASSGIELVKVMCPKSCGLCTPQQRLNKPTEQALKEIVSSWGTGVCRALNPLSKPVPSGRP